MKNIFKLMALFAFLFCFSSCEDDEPVIPTLEVTCLLYTSDAADE